MPNANMRLVHKNRLDDLEKLAKYFEEQSWDESWPADIICALARVVYPDRAPFRLVVEWERHGVVATADEADAKASNQMFYMMDIRDKDGKRLF